MFIDTHAHIIWDKLAGRETEVVTNALSAGVGKILTIGCDIETIEKSRLCAEKFENVFFTAGIHPSDAKPPIDWKKFEAFLSHPKCKAVGECGFDFFHQENTEAEQEEVFVKQLEFSEKHQKPLIIHTRDAGDKMLQYLKKYQPKKFVIHCFTETQAFADEIFALGGLVSIGGILTYPKADELRNIMKTFPLERIMLETDCPYLAPQSVRGQINEPKYIPEIARKLAEVKGISVEEIEKITTINAENFFGI